MKNRYQAVKPFYEMAGIPISWKKISRSIPRVRKFADDRAPIIEEIQKITEYPDRRIKAIVCIMASAGTRVGTWDCLKWKHIIPIASLFFDCRLQEGRNCVRCSEKLTHSSSLFREQF
jgi:hypothetical protein